MVYCTSVRKKLFRKLLKHDNEPFSCHTTMNFVRYADPLILQAE